MKVDLLDKVRYTIEKYDMAQKSERLLAGLSGGADSVALVVCLQRLGYDVEACHVNHCLRGEESDRDEEFCVRLCERLGIELTVKRIDVKGYCQANSLSTEEGARVLRYRAFDEIGADKICTAHNLNDCLETAVFNLARGTGLKGLASIPPVRDNIIRPLIMCSRDEIEGFLASIGQDFVTDSTNLEDEYSRNKIRHNVLPVMKLINPSLLNTYAQTYEFLKEDSDHLEREAESAYQASKVDSGYSVEILTELDFSIRRRTLMKIFKGEDLPVSNDIIMLADGILFGGGKINVKENYFAAVRGGVLYFYQNIAEDKPYQEEIKLDVPSTVSWQGRRLCFEIVENNGSFKNVNKKFANSCMDYDKIKGELVIRKRRAGDRIMLVNRDFSSDIRILMKKAFAPHIRDKAVILYDDDGAVLAESFGAADRVRIDSSTTRALIFYEVL